MKWDGVEVTPEPGWIPFVRFADGLPGTVRFQTGFFSGVFELLLDQQAFNRVFIDRGAVAWRGGVDLAPDAMFEEIKRRGEWLVEPVRVDASTRK